MSALGGGPSVAQGDDIVHGIVADKGLRCFGDHELVVRIHERADAVVSFIRGEFRLNEKQRVLKLVPKPE